MGAYLHNNNNIDTSYMSTFRVLTLEHSISNAWSLQSTAKHRIDNPVTNAGGEPEGEDIAGKQSGPTNDSDLMDNLVERKRTVQYSLMR